jgi:flagellar hook assembly protein FlgD
VTGISFQLFGNTSNSFNPSTTIHFELPVPSSVRLTVYDMLGQKIKSLLNDTHTAGNHHVVWDSKDNAGHDVASGVYF